MSQITLYLDPETDALLTAAAAIRGVSISYYFRGDPMVVPKPASPASIGRATANCRKHQALASP